MLVVCIEDDPVLGELIKCVMETEFAARVHVLADANAALETIADEPEVDLILLDARLEGGLDGMNTCRMLRAWPKLHATPIVFLTAERDESFARDALTLAVPIIRKPFDPMQLGHQLRGVLAGTNRAW